jgi:hypothetical protein
MPYQLFNFVRLISSVENNILSNVSICTGHICTYYKASQKITSLYNTSKQSFSQSNELIYNPYELHELITDLAYTQFCSTNTIFSQNSEVNQNNYMYNAVMTSQSIFMYLPYSLHL